MAKTHKLLCPKCEKVSGEIPNTFTLFRGEKDGAIVVTTLKGQKDYPDVTFKRIKRGDVLYGDLCQDCLMVMEVNAEVVLAGGAMLKCKECGLDDVVSAMNPMADILRKTAKLDKPNELGHYPPLIAEFEHCSEHNVGLSEEAYLATVKRNGLLKDNNQHSEPSESDPTSTES